MTKRPANLAKEARDSRDLAARGRRLATGRLDQRSNDRIERFAEELEQRAAELEAAASAALPYGHSNRSSSSMRRPATVHQAPNPSQALGSELVQVMLVSPIGDARR